MAPERPPFRDYHILLDEQAAEVFAATDPLAERVRKLGRPTIRSLGAIVRLRQIFDDDAEHTNAVTMLSSLLADNRQIIVRLRECHSLCDAQQDVATTSLIETWLDQAERRAWFLAATISGSEEAPVLEQGTAQ